MNIMNLGLGKIIYSPDQLKKFMRIQESQGTQTDAEHAYNGRADSEWGSGLPDMARDSIIDMVGYHLALMYGVISHTAAVALLVLFLIGICRMMFRENVIEGIRGCRWWLIGAFWGSLSLVVLAPMQWAMAKGHTIGRMVVH